MYVHTAFVEFQEATKDIGSRPETEQIHVLKFELYCALERAAALHTRVACLTEQLEAVKAEATEATQALATANADHDRELQALENICQSLLEHSERNDEDDAITLPRAPVAASI